MYRHLFLLFIIFFTSLPSQAEEVIYSEQEYLDRPLMERYILDELKASLTHLLRNSLDHGLESAEERRN